MKRVLLALALIIGLAGLFVAVPQVAATTAIQEGVNAARPDGMPTELFGDTGIFKQVTNTILYIVGVVAVIMLIIGGIKYVISGGDSKKVTDAKNTVLYAIIGLVISFLAFAIVNFVISALPSGENNGSEENKTSALVEDVLA